MKKRLLTLITIFAVLCTCLSFGTTAVADTDWRDGFIFENMVYNAAESQWLRSGGTYHNCSWINYDAGGNKVPVVFAEKGKSVAMVLTAPIDGTMTFDSGWFWVSSGNASMGITIYANDTLIASRKTLTGANGNYSTSNFNLPSSLSVSQGDKIYLVIDPDGTTDYDEMKVKFVVTITPAEGEPVVGTSQNVFPSDTENYGWEYFSLTPIAMATEDVSYKYDVADMTWSEENSCWLGTESQYVRVHKAYGSFYGILPGSNQNVALVYEVPATGVLTFNETNHLFWNCGAGNGGIGGTILHNGKVLMERTIISSGSAIDPMKGMSVKVKAGDELAFMVDGNGNNANTNSVLMIKLTVAPSDGSAAINTNFQENFGSTQGNGGWYYRTYTPKAAVATIEANGFVGVYETNTAVPSGFSSDSECMIFFATLEGSNIAAAEEYGIKLVAGADEYHYAADVVNFAANENGQYGIAVYGAPAGTYTAYAYVKVGGVYTYSATAATATIA